MLSDPKKREIFDTYGEEGLKAGAGGGAGPGGFGGMPGGGGQQFYQFHGDPRATFAAFFGGEDPFAHLFGGGSGARPGRGGASQFGFGGGHDDVEMEDGGFGGFGVSWNEWEEWGTGCTQETGRSDHSRIASCTGRREYW